MGETSVNNMIVSVFCGKKGRARMIGRERWWCEIVGSVSPRPWLEMVIGCQLGGIVSHRTRL
jgi:hypothetical protein